MANIPALPKWTDAQAVATYLTSLASGVVAVVSALHPGFTEPAVVQGILPAAALVVAGAAQLVNVITHRGAHAKVVVATSSRPGMIGIPRMTGPALAQQQAAPPVAHGPAPGTSTSDG